MKEHTLSTSTTISPMDFMSLCCCCCTGSGASSANSAPLVTFSQDCKGDKAQISNYTIAGTGVAFCTAPLIQTRAYFEVTILEAGEFCVGVSHKSCNKNVHLLGQPNAWCYSSGPNGGDWKVNDVLGVTFDLSEVIPVLQFYKNGVHMNGKDLKGVRGDVYPAVSVSGSCMLNANFGDVAFKFTPRPGFDRVIFSRDVL